MIVKDKDFYGYALVEAVSKIIDVNEGTVYPILKRLTNEGFFETYLEESSEGPVRKYYHITVAGKKRLKILLKEWKSFSESVNNFINGSDL